MKCPRCGHENRLDRRFCGQCGASLASACPACAFSNDPGEKFCGGCGKALAGASASKFADPASYTPKHLAERIINSRAALEGERKQVTVLFADLKGSMELLADRDPEEAQKLLDAVLERMMEAVHHYEGTVNQAMGDGIMALFGAPVAHEDHAVRACYAALRMQQSIKAYAGELRRSHGAVVKIRVGVNSGEVVVRTISSDLRMDYSAVGQTTHLASRIEQLADPGAIMITPATLALVEGYVEVKSLGPVPIKGLNTVVDVYEVTGAGPARTRIQAAARRGLTRFVGRDSELEVLRRAQQLTAGAQGQVVALVGEAGVGKSRLVYEFVHSHRLDGWRILESTSVSYGRATSYLPVIDLLKGYFKIQERDDLRGIREKVTGTLLALDRALEPALPALLALLDVPVDDAEWKMLDPTIRRRSTLDAVRRVLLREAREQPLLVIFEDLHWIDGETQALLDSLVDTLVSARLMLLVNYRPEYQHTWGGKTCYTQSRLDALPVESAGALLDALLGPDPGLAPLKQMLVKRGNPFFLEESVRTLEETRVLSGERGRYRLMGPVEAIQVPATVQTMLAARIDRLAPEDKHLLQMAAVVGKDVPFALLQAIADLPDADLRRGLDHLQTAEFLYEIGLYPDLEYSFKHALSHEVTYGSLLQARRRELHARIVAAIEMLYRDRLDGEVDRLAHHALQGELRDKALHYLRQAGRKAAARSALEDARARFEQALVVLQGLPENRPSLEQACDIRLEMRPVLTLLGDVRGALACLREAEALAEQLKDDRRRGRVCALMTNTHYLLAELDEAVASGVRGLDIARALGDLELRIPTMTYLEQAHYYRGDYAHVVELARENLAALPADLVNAFFGLAAPTSVYDRSTAVLSLAQLGRFAEADEPQAVAIRLAEATRHIFSLSMAYWGASTRHVVAGDWAAARASVEHWIAAVRSGNVILHMPRAVVCSAWVLAQLGDTAEALLRLETGEDLVAQQAARGIVAPLAWDYHALGRAYLLVGRLHDARRVGDLAIERARSQPGFASWGLHLLGDIASHRDGVDTLQAEACYRQALELAEPRGMRPLVAHCHLGLGTLSRQTGKRSVAVEQIAVATRMYRDMSMTYWLDKAEAEMRDLL